MANELFIHDMNPVKFVAVDPAQLPQYLTRHLELYRFAEQIYPWQQQTGYCQKWQKSDTIKLQMISDLDDITVYLIDENEVPFAIHPVIKGAEDLKQPGFYINEVSIPLNSVPEGNYYLKIEVENVNLISEPQQVKEFQENSLLLEYWNSRYHQNILFETGIHFSLRVEGAFGFLNPSSSDHYYTNQRFTPQVLSSKPYRNFPISFGGTFGIPDWLVDKINLAFTCNTVKVDGKEFAKTSETKFAFSEEEDYPMRGLTFEVREKVTTLSPQIKLFTAYWGVSNVSAALTKFGLQQASEAFTNYIGNGVFPIGGDVIADFSTAAIDKIYIIKVPADQPLFTIWENDPVFNSGTIGDFVFGPSFLGYNSIWRFYMTKRKVTFNANFPVTLKRS